MPPTCRFANRIGPESDMGRGHEIRPGDAGWMVGAPWVVGSADG